MAARGATPASADAVIPDIEIGRVYDATFRDAPVHYGSFGSLADFFGRDTAPHRHDRFYQLHFIQTGRLTLRLDDVDCAAEGPLFFLTPPSVPHAFSTNPAATGHVITVAQHLVWRLFDDDPTLPHLHRAAPRCVALSGPDGRHRSREFTRLFGLLRREVAAAAAGRQAAIEALTRLILIAAFRLLDAPPDPGAPRRHDLLTLRRFHELVDQHFAAHWTLPRYAAALHTTEVRLTDLCNRLAGRSPKRIVLDRLALEARRLLSFSHLPVNEVADALGFEDAAYFCRFFKRAHQITPSAYRGQANRGKVQSVAAKIPSAPRPRTAHSPAINQEEPP
jgi:AraC family 4-hydroxyphenylacetate 3-monooxygenase operon regulatory protein